MNYHRRRVAALFTFCLLIISPGSAQTYYSATKHMFLLYLSKEHAYLIPHLQRSFENSMRFHRTLFDYNPSENVTVFLQDFNDYGTGGATPLPWNLVNIGIEPYDYVYETGPTNERMSWVMNHELAHVVATDKPAASDRFFRSLFLGKVSSTSDNPMSMLYSYLTVPRWYCPRWYHEGFAVFMETWMAGGIGRALGGYDEMVFRTMVNDSSYFYDFVGLESEGKTIDFQVGANSYLYGTRFLSYLALHYGPEKLLRWFNRTDDSRAYFASQFEEVYGSSLDDEWSKWITWEHEWQRANLDSVHLHPLTPSRPITPLPLGSVSRAHFDPSTRKLYTAMNLPGQLAKIVAVDVDRGTIESITDVSTPAMYYVTSLAFDRAGKRLFYTTHNSRYWRSINVVDIKTGKTKELMKDARIGDLVYNQIDSSLWGIQHHNGYSSVVRCLPPYNGWRVVLALKYGKDFFDIDISPDGKFLSASMAEISGRQTLVKLPIDSLLQGKVTYQTLVEFDNSTSPYNFVFSADGKSMYGTTYYTGISNVVKYDLEKNEKIWISNCATGYFRPVPVSDDSLIVFRYTGKGFLPVVIPNRGTDDVSAVRYLGQEIVEKYPVVQSWTVQSPLKVNLDTLSIVEGEYHGLDHIRVTSAYPIVEGYKDHVGFGERIDLMDIGYDHTLNATLSYSPNRNLSTDERFHAGVTYEHSDWKFIGRYNGADFYDLFGPTKTSRKGYSLLTRYTRNLLFDQPKKLDLTISLAGYGGLERLPDFQNVTATFDKFLTSSIGLNYVSLLRSLGSVEAEEGTRIRCNAAATFVQSDAFPGIYANLERGFLLPIDHSSLWLRATAGIAGGDRAQSFSNFYFGGFGNNWVDYQEPRRFREYYSFPGIEINEIGGSNFLKAQVEWTLPPVRFRRFGFSSLYCNWTQLTLFSSGIVTNLDLPADQEKAIDAGGQIDFKLIMFSNLESTLSFGYALAARELERRTTEFMMSLKILK